MNKLIYIATLLLLLLSGNSFALEDNLIEALPRKVTTIKQVDAANFKNTAILQSLNKITAKTKKLEIKVGKEMQFGKLDILVHKCWQSPAYEEPENKILLEIFQRKSDEKDEDKKRIFFGWMISSSPSISSLEHPIYDITALECLNNKK